MSSVICEGPELDLGEKNIGGVLDLRELVHSRTIAYIATETYLE